MNSLASYRSNRILATLSAEQGCTLAPHLTPVEFEVGDVLEEAGRPIEFVYFPTSCIVSFVATTAGRSVGVGVVGKNGMTGVGAVLGVYETPVTCVVQSKGCAIRVPAAEFSGRLLTESALREAALRFAYSSIALSMMLAACNIEHDLRSRLARWLLATGDCSSTATFRVTQEYLAQMLGTRRPTISTIASQLQKQKLISYRRGLLRLLDRKGLGDAACSCYRRMSKHAA